MKCAGRRRRAGRPDDVGRGRVLAHERRGAGLHGREDLLVAGVHGEDHQPGRRRSAGGSARTMSRPVPSGSWRSVTTTSGCISAQAAQRLRHRAGLADDRQVVVAVERPGQAVTDQLVVVDEEDRIVGVGHDGRPWSVRADGASVGPRLGRHGTLTGRRPRAGRDLEVGADAAARSRMIFRPCESSARPPAGRAVVARPGARTSGGRPGSSPDDRWRPAVLDGVVHRLLADPQQLGLHLGAQPGVGARRRCTWIADAATPRSGARPGADARRGSRWRRPRCAEVNTERRSSPRRR